MAESSLTTWQQANLDRLIRVEPKADEYFGAYAGRVANVHGATSIGRLVTQITGRSSIQGWGGKVPLLALTAGMDKDSFVRLHTCFHLNTPFLLDKSDWGRPVSLWAKYHFKHLAAKSPRLRYCPDCVVEDLGFWKHSYWRRSHQIPGIEWCTKHGTLLTATDLITSNPQYQEPAEFLRGSRFSGNQQASEKPIPLAARFAEIYFGLADMRGLFTRNQLVDLLKTRAASVGYNCEKLQDRKSLTYDIYRRARLDSYWFQQVLPEFDPTRPQKAISAVYWAFVSRQASNTDILTFILLMAMLWSSAEDALSDLNSWLHSDRTSLQ